jgi:hypothetical protein
MEELKEKRQKIQRYVFLREAYFFFKKGFFHGLAYEFGNYFKIFTFLKKDITYFDRLRLFLMKTLTFIF